ncbi:MAG: hypothetical protein CM15mV13_1890 [uncultured marine virus]|nr:MAG: hypothetical protein CM15mV13_1890 [uncultured marine virus]
MQDSTSPKREDRIPFDLEYFNKVTKGGLPNKTLNIVLAGTGVGKSLAMCHFASANLQSNYNVLYITMEMAEGKLQKELMPTVSTWIADNWKTSETYVRF